VERADQSLTGENTKLRDNRMSSTLKNKTLSGKTAVGTTTPSEGSDTRLLEEMAQGQGAAQSLVKREFHLRDYSKNWT